MDDSTTDFKLMTLTQLKQFARDNNVKGFSNLKKDALILKLEETMKQEDPPKVKIKLKAKKLNKRIKLQESKTNTTTDKDVSTVAINEVIEYDIEDYVSDGVKLYHGDCLEKMSLIPDDSVDLILCDLPYGTTKCKWDTVINMDKLWEHYKRIIKKPHGVIALFGQQPFTSMLVSSNYKWYKYNLIWKKNKTTQYLLANYRPMKCTEDICVFSPGGAAAASRHKGNMTYNPQGLVSVNIKKKNSAKRIGKMLNQSHHLGPNNKLVSNSEYRQKFTNYPTEFIEFDIENDTTHETQKPVPLIEYLIKTYSNEGGVVLDNTMGSGTTGVGCIHTKRNFIGIELDDKYYDLSKKRILKELIDFTSQDAQ